MVKSLATDQDPQRIVEPEQTMIARKYPISTTTPVVLDHAISLSHYLPYQQALYLGVGHILLHNPPKHRSL